MDLIAMIVAIVLGILLFTLFIKNIHTWNIRMNVNYAIFRYRIDCIDKGVVSVVDWEDMVSYEHTLFKLWDWSSKNVLSKEKYKIIKPYLRRRTR